MGERHIATSVALAKGMMKNPRFYGKEVRGTRRHYAWLRRRLEERKLLHVIERIRHTEKRKVNAILHNISIAVVDEAKNQKAAILLGGIRGIRKIYHVQLRLA